jgi:hypothetical protein
VAWRQAVTAARGLSRLLVYGLPIAALVLFAVFLTADVSSGTLFVMIAATGFVSTLYFPMMFRFDFRADLDKFESLKVLPIHRWMLTAGQLLTPVAIATTVQLLFVAPCAVATGEVFVIPYLLLFAPLVNTMLFSVENAVFLVFPTRIMVAGPGDFQVMARMYLTFILKGIVLVACLGTALGPAGIAYWLSDSLPVAAALTALILAVEIAAAIWCTAWAFQRFDPSVDTPA